MNKKNKACERENYYGVNNQGSKFRVVYYKNADNVYVEFYDHPKAQVTIVRTTWANIQRKYITDIFQPTVYGVGFLGRTTCVNNDGTLKESYTKWRSMLMRCYDSKYHIKYPTYIGCSVSEEWKCFENFERDYESLLKENNFPKDIKLALDKDILFKKNKVYSKENSVLVPSKLNNIFVKCDRSRSNLPIGVSYDKKNKKNPYVVRLSSSIKAPNHKQPYHPSKNFQTPLEAFEHYKKEKESIIRLTAINYLTRGYISENSRLFKALMNYKVEVDD